MFDSWGLRSKESHRLSTIKLSLFFPDLGGLIELPKLSLLQLDITLDIFRGRLKDILIGKK